MEAISEIQNEYQQQEIFKVTHIDWDNEFESIRKKSH